MSRTTNQRPLVEMQAGAARTPSSSGYVARAGSLIDDEPAPQPKKGASGPSLREKLAGLAGSGGGKIALVVLCVAALAFGAFRFFGEAAGPSKEWPRFRVMNADSGALKWFYTAPGAKLEPGFHPVEYCFAKECGPAGGTPVILGFHLGKDGDTVCPKCGSEVVPHNPRPDEYLTTQPADQKR